MLVPVCKSTRLAPRTTVIQLNKEMDLRLSPHVAMNLGAPIPSLPYSASSSIIIPSLSEAYTVLRAPLPVARPG